MFRIIILAAAIMVAGQGNAIADEVADKIRASMQKIVPNLAPDTVEPSELDGFYEVTYGAEVFYVTADGRYLLNGSLMDLSNGKDLTEVKRAKGRLRLIGEMDESKMLIYSPEKVKHSITVFTDIDCPYCRRMHQEMDELNEYGIEVRYLLFPRAGLNSKSYNKAVTVWCSDDRLQAMTDAKAGKRLEDKKCDNPVDEHMALVEKLGISGTPYTVIENGTLIPGYVPAARLITVLDSEAGS